MTTEITGPYYIENMHVYPDTGSNNYTEVDLDLFEGFYKEQDPKKTRSRIRIPNLRLNQTALMRLQNALKRDEEITFTMRFEYNGAERL